MCKLFTALTIVIILLFGTPQKDNPTNQKNIAHVENNLIAFKSPANMLYPNSEQLANPKNLADRMDFYKVPGVSIAVINNNKIAWSKAYGILDKKTGTPVTQESIFEAASTSKFITAVIALHFIQKHLIDLDTNVNNYLKSWQVPENEFTKTEKVTLRRLLTHMAGLPTTNFNHDENAGYPTLINVLNGESPAINKPAVPELVPGTKWQYSNIGYDVIQLLLEDISGKPFQKIAEEIVFAPLEMHNSTFVYPLDPAKKKREAMPHDADGIQHEPAMNLTALAHAGLTTTPTDLAKFTIEIMRSYKGKSNKILSPEMTKKLFQKQYDIDPALFGIPFSEGLGILLMGEDKDLVFTHPGSNIPGLNCWLIGWLERGNAAVIMTNGAQGEVLAMEIISAINLEYNK